MVLIWKSFSSPAFQTNKSALHGKTIVLDPGHGGIDPGCGAEQGVKEKDINLDIALRTKKALEAKGARVILTRKSDVALETKGPDRQKKDILKRAQIASNSSASILVSIHVNSIDDNIRLRGPIVYYHPSSSASREVANRLQKRLNLIYEGAKGYKPIKHAPRRGNYLLLKSTRKPAVIVETGFITNPGDFVLLHSAKYKNNMAQAIAAGLEEYFAKNSVPAFSQSPIVENAQDIGEEEFRETTGKLAIIVRGLGGDMKVGQKLLDYNRPLTLAVLPFEKFSRQYDEKGYASGHEIIMDMDISGQTEDKVERFIQEAQEQLSHSQGVHYHGNSDEKTAMAFFKAIKEHSIYMVGDAQGDTVAVESAALASGFPFHRGGEVLEGKADAAYIQENLIKAGQRAILSRSAMLILDIRDMDEEVLLNALSNALPRLEEMGLDLVYANELMDY